MTRIVACLLKWTAGGSHYLEALEFQREYIRLDAVQAGKIADLQTFLVGGMATSMDRTSRRRC